MENLVELFYNIKTHLILLFVFFTIQLNNYALKLYNYSMTKKGNDLCSVKYK